MKAKDTVMNPIRLSEVIQMFPNWSLARDNKFIQELCEYVSQKQAEVSFKYGMEYGNKGAYESGVYNGYTEGLAAGIKEVVEWSNETCPHDLFGEGTQCFKRACDLCWQDKLKGWGVEVS